MALLVVANADRRVIGYVGSSDYLDQPRGGPIDMVRAVRSPGSALKPFIYGLGFDDLALAPATIMVDRPTRFSGWAPRNFDRLYRGEVTAAEALQLSLNIPAVAILQRVGPLRFLTALDDAGAPLTLPDDDAPGLPIALGGVGISLESLVTLYSGLADGGRVKPLRLTPDAPTAEGTRLVSPMAAWYLMRILADTPPPPNLMPGQHTGNGRVVSFKTGTSYGFRDAWAIGYDRDYTVGVWVGRPDGGFSPGRIGREAAAPALFEAFSLLPRPGPESMMPPPPPPGVRLASNADLAPALRRFGAPGAEAGADPSPARSNGPVIAFPPPGAMVDLARDDAGLPRALPLRVEGGRMPLTWMVNGLPIGRSTYRRQAEWLPDGAGAARITVVDGAGQMASADIWLQ
jgi:penicillin-binding protein 1C